MSPFEHNSHRSTEDMKSMHIEAGIVQKAREIAESLVKNGQAPIIEPIEIENTGLYVVTDASQLILTLGSFELNNTTFYIGATA